MGHGRMAGLTVPSASPAELGLLACWGAFITLVDDGFDRHPGPISAAQVRAVLDPLVAVVSGTGAGAAGDTPVVAALEELWERTCVGTEPGWRARFAACYASFADATVQEARWGETGHTPSREEYVRLRRRTITVSPLLLVAERLAGAWPSTEVLHEVCADVVAWTNDLMDAGSRRAGEVTLVETLVQERNADRGEAAAIVRAMIEERLEDFETAAGQLTARHAQVEDVRSRAGRVRTFMYGAVAWQYESGRYRAALPHQRVSGDLSDPVESAAVRLERRLALAVAPGGALPDRCAGRVLETALLLALLRTRGTHRDEQRELTAWLDDRREGADRLDALLIDACLSPHTLPADAADAASLVADGSDAGVGGRGRLKRSMLHAVLHVLGGLRLTDEDAPGPASTDTLSTYSSVHLLAVRVLYAQATGYPYAVTSGERFHLADLLDDTSGRLLWEASATTHLLGLNALQSYRAGHPLIERAVTGLLHARAHDGGMPFLDSQDVWLSAVAGLGFLGRPALRPYTSRMGEFVAARQARDGGWPFAGGVRQTDVDTAARCMEFLHALDAHRYRRHLRRGAAYLAATAGPDGGFPTWLEGDEPDLDMTAGAVIALAPFGEEYAPLVATATGFVLDAQHADGTWTPSWTVSEPSVILRAVDALHAARDVPGIDRTRTAAATARAVARLTSTQQVDGGWGPTPGGDSDALSTAQAMTVVARYGPPHAASTATAHLLARQDEFGRFPAPPDQVGPRPLPFDFPVVADLHALTALHHAGALAAPDHRIPAGTPGTAHRKPSGTSDPGCSALESSMRGVLLRPEQAAYEQARLLVNQRFDDIRPQAIAYPADVQDVVECVNFARTGRIPLALRSGGHSYAGYSTGPGLVLDVSSLNTATVGGGQALFGAGVKGGQAHLALAAAGAGLPLGRCPTIGLAGVTLGGGLSAFTRAWGLACDHLREVEIVTADGHVRRVRPDSPGPDGDLFWALCGGGGGNFGVVTALEFATEDIRDLSFTRFMVTWPDTATAAVIQGWTAWNADPATPRAVSCAFKQLSDSGMPSLPTVTGTFIGAPADLQPVLDRLTAAVGRSETDRVTVPCDYTRAASEADRWGGGTWGPRVAFAAKSHIVREPLGPVSSTDMAAALEKLHRFTGVGGAGGLLIDALGGAVDDRPAHATAFPHRSAVGVVQYHSYWHRFTDRAHVDRRLTWLREVHATMQPHLGTGGYTNGMDPELTEWAVAYHGENYPRMQRVKATHDPEQLFTFPQAVTPQPAPGATGTPRGRQV
ncbi:putative FAD-linked oxidoreductase YvdP [Streptomyces turgidiscabies]|nr:putative FAD-linked oxidoreductase YvdP [Streptomyces turgidiscabies]